MIKTILSLILLLLFVSGCANKNGLSTNYYSECKEYYDFQGYYHKECSKDDFVTYQEMGDFFKKKVPQPEHGNVW